MRVMIMTQYYPPNHTAAGTRVYELAKELSAHPGVDNIDVVVWNPLFERTSPIPRIPKTRVHEVRTGKDGPAAFYKYQDPNPIYAHTWLALTKRFAGRCKPNIIYFSTPPGVMLAGTIWCRAAGIKYMIDYRDNWAAVNENLICQRSPAERAAALIPHFATLAMADLANRGAGLISTVHRSITDDLKIPPSKVVEIRNGTDSAEVMAAEPDTSRLRPNMKHIAYVGNLATPYYSPEVLIPAMERKKNYQLMVFSTGASRRFRGALEKSGLEERTRILNVEHKGLLSILKACDAAFLALQKGDPQGAYAIPAKFYDYISCGLPVLVIADGDSYIYKFVKSNGNGIALTWSQTPLIESSLESVIESPVYRENALKIVPGMLKKFDRRRNNRKLIGHILKLRSR